METQSIKGTKGLKEWISNNYRKIDTRKFDILKTGAMNVIFIIDRNGYLQREVIFRGNMSMFKNQPKASLHQLKMNMQRIASKHNLV
jgi:hypothetical protein